MKFEGVVSTQEAIGITDTLFVYSRRQRKYDTKGAYPAQIARMPNADQQWIDPGAQREPDWTGFARGVLSRAIVVDERYPLGDSTILVEHQCGLRRPGEHAHGTAAPHRQQVHCDIVCAIASGLRYTFTFRHPFVFHIQTCPSPATHQ